jgi:hypothetical protein
MLVYEGGEMVHDQSILREIAPPKVFGASSTTVCTFRIDEVSSYVYLSTTQKRTLSLSV